MRLVEDICPGCGARIRVDADASEARFSYCSATFRPGAPRPPVPGGTPRAPRRPSSGAWIIGGALGILAIVGIVLTRSGGTPAPSAAPISSATEQEPVVVKAPVGPRWLPHHQELLAELNGDGLRDPILGAGYGSSNGNTLHLVALDAATGKRLWQSEAFPHEGWAFIHVILMGENLLAADTAGMLRAIAVKSGKTIWSTPLGERVRRVCRQTDSGALLDLEDRRRLEVAFSTGTLTPHGNAVVPLDADCETLPSLRLGEDPRVRVISPSSLFGGRAELDGMNTSLLILPNEGPLAFALGVRTPGTRLPTVAAFPRPETLPKRGSVGSFTAVWKSAAAGNSTMAAAERAQTVAWYGDRRLYVPYTTTTTPPAEHLVAFEAATGRILYDVLLDGVEATRLDALTGADGRLYATHSKGLDAFDASSGKHLVHLSD